VVAKKRLTPAEWAEAEALWQSGTVVYEDLEKKYKVAVSTFQRHFKNRGIVKGSRADLTKKAVEEKLKSVALDDATIMAARIRETKEQHYTMATNLGKLIWNEILESKRAGAAVATVINNIKTLKEAAQGLALVRAERYAVLGLDRPDAIDPDEMPELVVAELTQEQIQELRDRDTSELDEIAPSDKKGGDDDDKDIDDDDGPDVVEEG
jgi:hypothetical protein